MIISHKYKFIFIKTRKTAGTSIEKFLAPFCGEEDVITPDHLHAEEDHLREIARNYDSGWNLLNELFYPDHLLDIPRAVRDKLKRPTFYNHISARCVKARVSKNIWDSYYKFSFERNPWDKCISFYYWQSRGNKNLGDFNDYLTNLKGGLTLDQALPIDWKRYSYRNNIIVDDVFDFSDLQNNLKKALSNTTFPIEELDVMLPKMKGNLRKHDFTYTTESDLLIRKYFYREIEQFNFEKPDYL
jgi:hypothetical protein